MNRYSNHSWTASEEGSQISKTIFVLWTDFFFFIGIVKSMKIRGVYYCVRWSFYELRSTSRWFQNSLFYDQMVIFTQNTYTFTVQHMYTCRGVNRVGTCKYLHTLIFSCILRGTYTLIGTQENKRISIDQGRCVIYRYLLKWHFKSKSHSNIVNIVYICVFMIYCVGAHMLYVIFIICTYKQLRS